MAKILAYPTKRKRSVLSQMNYSSQPRYASVKIVTRGTNSSILGMTKYNENFGVEKNDAKRFPNQDK